MSELRVCIWSEIGVENYLVFVIILFTCWFSLIHHFDIMSQLIRKFGVAFLAINWLVRWALCKIQDPDYLSVREMPRSANARWVPGIDWNEDGVSRVAFLICTAGRIRRKHPSAGQQVVWVQVLCNTSWMYCCQKKRQIVAYLSLFLKSSHFSVRNQNIIKSINTPFATQI